MNAKKAKALRRMARIEMITDQGVVPRELVIARVRGHDRVINEPNSIRAMNLKLKTAYKAAQQKGTARRG